MSAIPHGVEVPSTLHVKPEETDWVQVYVWSLPVRVWHWLMVLSILSLSFTGYYIGDPFIISAGEARFLFTMGTMKMIHFAFAFVLAIALVIRLPRFFIGNRWERWNQFLPTTQKRQVNAFKTILFYSFLKPKPPPAIGHNPMAGLSYIGIFGLLAVEFLTGFVLYGQDAPDGSVWRSFEALMPLIGGAQTARWIHHVVMYLLLGFAIQHVYSALLMSLTERTAAMESIFSGFKYVPRHELEEELAEEAAKKGKK